MNPLFFRREHHTGLPDAEAFTGDFTYANPYVLHDGATGDSELAIFVTAATTTYLDMAGLGAPSCQWFVAGVAGRGPSRVRSRGR